MAKQHRLRVLLELHRATHQVGLIISKAAPMPLTQAEAIVLAHLLENQPSTMSHIHRAFGHKRSTLTGIVDRLVERGLVTREPAPGDRRAVVVQLSRKGLSVAGSIHDRLWAMEAAALKNKSPADVRRLKEVLDGLAGVASV